MYCKQEKSKNITDLSHLICGMPSKHKGTTTYRKANKQDEDMLIANYEKFLSITTTMPACREGFFFKLLKRWIVLFWKSKSCFYSKHSLACMCSSWPFIRFFSFIYSSFFFTLYTAATNQILNENKIYIPIRQCIMYMLWN